MTFDEYQKAAKKTAIYPKKYKIVYPAIGLAGEAGEVCNKIKKIIRDSNNKVTDTAAYEIGEELGDCCWYLAAIATDLNLNLEDIMRHNLGKLKNRAKKNTLHGSGDKR